MTLVDTSLWIEYLRDGSVRLASLLLACAALAPGSKLWSADRRLAAVAADLQLAYP